MEGGLRGCAALTVAAPRQPWADAAINFYDSEYFGPFNVHPSCPLVFERKGAVGRIGPGNRGPLSKHHHVLRILLVLEHSQDFSGNSGIF